ncbi:hypothetical protein CN279_25215 [Bacillus anthracis]|nr:hypothetical protein CN279_25215 [Bacillus anthracis]
MEVRIIKGYSTTVFLGKISGKYQLEKANFYVGETFNVVGQASFYGQEHWICDSNGTPGHEPFFLLKEICELV